jgi:chromate transporter
MTSIQPTIGELIRVFARIGCVSFGGPAGQIALMHSELVEQRGWIDEQSYLRALNFCHLLPGPEAQQLATLIGWRLAGTVGGLIAGLLFVIPGALVILALSFAYVLAAGTSWFDGLFLGIKAAVLAIVVQALIRIARRALHGPAKIALAAAAFVALALFNLPFPLVVLGAGLFGLLFFAGDNHSNGHGAPLADASVPVQTRAALILATVRTVAIWLAIWAAPVILLLVTLGEDHVLVTIAAYFSKLAVVTFGGAYAVLSYMAQEAVQTHGWLSAGEMADGLGLAETTPGPLIMVTQFVGFLGAMRAPEPFTPYVAALLGAGITTWVTFAPCFLFIFALAPWIERLEKWRRLQAGLSALTAAIVGVIANLALWFALHVLFARVGRYQAGPVDLALPDVASLDSGALGISVLAFALAFGARLGTLPLLGVCAGAGLAVSALR